MYATSMSSGNQAGFGMPGRRRQRLTDRETEQRMLSAALAAVSRTGLSVSLEHIRLEEVIREAGVSRSAVYRRWPYKDMFYADLLRELAKGREPFLVPDRSQAMEAMRALAAQHADLFETAEGRRELAVELLRQGNLEDYAVIAASAQWRTYIGLHATYLSLDDGALRDDVHRLLVQSELNLAGYLARTVEGFAALLGFRLRPDLEFTFETVAALAIAMLRGAVIMNPVLPELEARAMRGNPFGGIEPAEWSPVAMAMTSLVMSFLEPDPAVRWDAARLAAVRAELGAAT